MWSAKYYTSVLLVGIYALSYSSIAFAAPIATLDCSYNSDFQRCMQASRNGTARGIEDFVCLQSQDQAKVLDQIILDEKFKEIDEEVEAFLERLDSDKESAVTSLNENIDAISNNLAVEGVFYKQYKALCNGWILAERLSCTEKISNSEAALRIKNAPQNQTCIALVKTKLDIYSKVAADIQKLNKSAVLQDNKQEYWQELRTKYDGLLQIMLDIIWYLERLYNGLTHYTPNPL